MNKYDIAFIMYITGYRKETIEQLHENWLRIKDAPDFEEFHPVLHKQLQQTVNQ